MFRTLAAAVLALALTAASASAQAPKLGMSITGYGTHSVQVLEVFSGSVAEQMGIQPGDIVYGINGGSTNNPIAFRNAVFGSDRVTLNVQRGNRVYTKWVWFNGVPRQDVAVVVTTTQTVEVSK